MDLRKAPGQAVRYTYATQLLNAVCRATSIQRFLGHKELSSTMVYARAHDQTVAEDYFAAMQRVEERLNTLPEPKQDTKDEVVKVQEQTELFQLIEKLELPELCLEERLCIANQLRQTLHVVYEHTPPEHTKAFYFSGIYFSNLPYPAQGRIAFNVPAAPRCPAENALASNICS